MHEQKNFISIFLLVPFVLGMLMTSLAGNVQASRSVKPSKLAVADCYSLDVIFLIDQSGSMSGHLSARPSDRRTAKICS